MLVKVSKVHELIVSCEPTLCLLLDGAKFFILKVDMLCRPVNFHVSLRVSKERLRSPAETLDCGSMVNAVRVSALSMDVDSEAVEVYGGRSETCVMRDSHDSVLHGVSIMPKVSEVVKETDSAPVTDAV